MGGAVQRRRFAATIGKAVVLTLALASGIAAAFSVAAAAATVVTVTPSDDTYVTEPARHQAHGSLTYLRIDANPNRRGFLRFEISGLAEPVARATLKLFAITSHETGVDIHAVENSPWNELTLTHENAPTASAVVTASTGEIRARTWAVADVTALVSGNGTYTFALTTASSRPVIIASKESGPSSAPQLVVESVAPPTTTAPATTAAPPTTTEPPPPPTTSPPPTTTDPPPTTTEPPPTTTEPPPTTTEPPPTTTEPPPTTTEPPPTTTEPPPTTTEPPPTTTEPPPDTSSPSVPTGITATGLTATTVSVSWSASSDNVGVIGYGVYVDGTLVGSTSQRTFTASGLTCGKSYAVTVDAYDGAGNRSPQSTPLTVATSVCPDTQAPSAPGSLRATAATTSSVVVAWNPSTDNVAVTGYRVYKDGAFVTTTTSTSHSFGSLTCGTAYTFGVDAYDAAGNLSSPRTTLTTATAACPAPPSGSDPVIAIAGDIAGDGTGDTATALLLDSLGANAVLTAGDNAYDDGSSAQYTQYYDPTWGRHKSLTHPTPGNHEYHTSGASGYFGYFGSRAGTAGQGWYSYDLGSWHLIALNSEVSHGATSAQVTWLKNDLAATGAPCVLAYWHKPRFTAGNYSDMSEFQPFWDALYAANAEVVVNGHDHNYQRYAPMTPTGVRDGARGIREFVAGTGGRSHYGLRADSRREAGNDTSYGVLKLTLRTAGYDWQFIPEAGKTFTDSGSGSCH
jgi:chitodextrinase